MLESYYFFDKIEKNTIPNLGEVTEVWRKVRLVFHIYRKRTYNGAWSL